MKNIQFISLLLMALLNAATASAQFTETREFVKRFRVKPETRIEITNKYGKIDLQTWDKDSVVIEVKMTVEEKKLDRLEKALDNIDFDFTNSQHYLIARTMVDQNRSQIENELLRFKETLLQTNGNITINYRVWMPAINNLKIENKFGDIYLGDLAGEVDISLSNGKLKANDFAKRTNITLNFGGATINKMASGRIFSNYSDLYLKQADRLRIDSKSSTIEIVECKELTVDSRRDQYRIRMAQLLEADGDFSNFRLSELNDRANLRMSYGDIEMDKIRNSFSNIYIESRSTDINLQFEPNSALNFEITESKADLYMDREWVVAKREEIDPKEKKNRVSGYLGKKSDKPEKLYINAIAGKIRLLTR